MIISLEKAKQAIKKDGLNPVLNKVINTNVIDGLKALPKESINCVITSPPYFQARDYGTEGQVWGGDPDCDHEWSDYSYKVSGKGGKGKQDSVKGTVEGNSEIKSKFCKHCGAWKGELGMEPDSELFLDHLADIFDEVYRILRKDGSLYIVIGDKYSNSGGSGRNPKNHKQFGKVINKGTAQPPHKERGCPSKSALLVPYRLAFKLIQRGWVLRNLLIWRKPNCMVQSVKDRFTVDYEPVLFLVKSERYYYKQILEPFQDTTIKRSEGTWSDNGKWSNDKVDENFPTNTNKVKKYFNKVKDGVVTGRNKRAVWDVSLNGYRGGHYAVYPEGLVEIPLETSCPQKVCKKCGKPVTERLVETGNLIKIGHAMTKKDDTNVTKTMEHYVGEGSLAIQGLAKEKKRDGYNKCDCNAGFVSGTVLDPFMGSGTTAIVAFKRNLSFLGIELNSEYCNQIVKRFKHLEQSYTKEWFYEY